MKPAPPVTSARTAHPRDRPGRWSNVPPMFVTFEGLDGSGKTTQARLLADALDADGVEVVLTREPGGTPLGEEIRRLVLHGDHVAPWAEAALYTAARAQHVEEVIRPALARGATVVCDRYVDSSVAYQGVGRGLGLDAVLDLNLARRRRAAPRPDVPASRSTSATAVERVGERHDRIEQDRRRSGTRRRRLPGARGALPRAVSSSSTGAARSRELAEEVRDHLR